VLVVRDAVRVEEGGRSAEVVPARGFHVACTIEFKRALIGVQSLGIVALSDLVLGWHNTIAFTWTAFVLTGLIGWWVRRQPVPGRIVAGALGGSLLFFLLTNFGVWLVGGLYPLTTEGVWRCYVAALPFFRGTLLGDLAYTMVFFGSYALATGERVFRHPAPSR
jgi:hypothetical protein